MVLAGDPGQLLFFFLFALVSKIDQIPAVAYFGSAEVKSQSDVHNIAMCSGREKSGLPFRGTKCFKMA